MDRAPVAEHEHRRGEHRADEQRRYDCIDVVPGGDGDAPVNQEHLAESSQGERDDGAGEGPPECRKGDRPAVSTMFASADATELRAMIPGSPAATASAYPTPVEFPIRYAAVRQTSTVTEFGGECERQTHEQQRSGGDHQQHRRKHQRRGHLGGRR